MAFLLPPPPEGWLDDKEVLESLSGWPYQRTIEAAGRYFPIFVQKKKNDFLVHPSEGEEDEKEADKEEEDAAWRAKAANKHKNWSKEKAEDYYELLGLGDMRWRASADDIKQAYRKMILIYHPDKMKAASQEKQEVNDEIFKSIQKAYDIMSDPKKRKAYDSEAEFDDSIPTEKQANKQDFFDLFDPVFERNARWSTVQPAPRLGDKNSPWDQVKKFYDFWWKFTTWREFRHEDEYDLEQAEHRDERRWMEKQNAKLSAPLKKAERARINALTELAYKKDPRVKRHEEFLEEEKRKRKEAKDLQQKKKQEAIDRQAELLRQKIEAEEKRKADEAAEAKRKKDREAKTLRKKRNEVRALCRSLPKPPYDDQIEIVVARLSMLQMEELLQAMQPVPDHPPERPPFDQLYNSLKKEDQDRIDREREEELRKKQEKDRPWSEEELSNLAKGIQKFPGGQTNRWEMIAELVGTRSPKEIAAKVKEIKVSQQFANKNQVFQVRDPFEKMKAKVGEKDIQSPLSQRFDEFEESAPATSATSAASTSTTTSTPTPAPTPTPTPSPSPSPSPTPAPASAPAPVSKPTAAPSKPAPAPKGPAKSGAPSKAGAPGPAAGAAPPATPPAAAGEGPVWTAEEQKLLEKGLQQFPSSMEDRWDKISGLVKTKTKKECVARFKHLVTLLKAGKK